MNSLTARNAALLLIFFLLWNVLSGIYGNLGKPIAAQETQISRGQEIARDNIIRHSPITSTSISPAESSYDSTIQRSLTADEIQQIVTTGRLPSWVKNAENKRLSMEEIEEIVYSGKLPTL